jgi:hypothetical protein
VARAKIFDDEVPYILAAMAKDMPEADRLQVILLITLIAHYSSHII